MSGTSKADTGRIKIKATTRDRALATFEEAGIDLQNSKPDEGPRRWFAGPTSPTIIGDVDLEATAWYVARAYENGRQAGTEETVQKLMDRLHEQQADARRRA